MDAYCKLFELDWRGDVALENRENLLMQSPIYTHASDRSGLSHKSQVTNTSVVTHLKQACSPYLPSLLQKMSQQV